MNRSWNIIFFSVVVCVAWAGRASAAPDQPALEDLGKRVFFDNISDPARMACSTCHVAADGWTGKVAGINKGQVAITGANPHTVGGRKPPTAAYASFSPPFGDSPLAGIPGIGPCRSATSAAGIACKGGVFWDGRADGTHVGAEVFGGNAALASVYQAFLGPTADQALGPFPNDVEQNVPNGNDGGLPGAEAVCRHVQQAKYAELFTFAWGEPINCEPAGVALSFKRIAVAISAWEHSSEINSFSSKRDQALANDNDATPGAFPLAGFTAQENLGHELFYGRARCSACHNSGAPTSTGTEPQQLYTDEIFHHIGVPPNFEIANFDPAKPDVGLQQFTQIPGHAGHFRAPTLRNVDKRGGNGFTKAYMHNGYFKSLEDVVHFYNTAAILSTCVAGTTAADARQQNCWPAAEVPHPLSARGTGGLVGNLGLTADEEAAIVAYLKTLSDTAEVKQPAPYKKR